MSRAIHERVTSLSLCLRGRKMGMRGPRTLCLRRGEHRSEKGADPSRANGAFQFALPARIGDIAREPLVGWVGAAQG